MTPEQIKAALQGIVPETQLDVVSFCDGLVKIDVILVNTADPSREALFAKIKETVLKLPEVKEVNVGISLKTPAAKPAFAPKTTAPAPQEQQLSVKHIIAVSSGKGGVGKTTVSVNLACALEQQGFKVGILDADIYGPNVPIMMGLRQAKLGQNDEQKLVPPENHNVKVVSMAFLIKEEQPVVWRGPMLDKVIRQFLTDTAWDADYLIIDLPPGTGDAQLTVMQSMPVTGAIIVTTPQEVAIHDSRKGLAMFKSNDVPVFGIVENMSYFVGDDGKRYELFGNGGGRRAAEELEVPFLSEIPLVPIQREQADEGMPIVVSDPEGAQAQVFKQLAKTIVEAVEKLDAKKLAAV